MTLMDESAERPVRMTVEAAKAVRARVCDNRRRLGRGQARAQAATCNVATGPGEVAFNAFRCPFSGGEGRHWHVGHVISPQDMATVAQAIRTLHQEAA